MSLQYNHKNKFYSELKHADEHVRELAQCNVPIHSFFVANYPDTQSAFEQMSKTTKGTSSYLDLSDKAQAAQNLFGVFGNTVITDVAGDDELKKKLLKEYAKNSYSKK